MFFKKPEPPAQPAAVQAAPAQPAMPSAAAQPAAAATPPAQPLSKEVLDQRAMIIKAKEAALGQIVTLLAQVPGYQDLKLNDLRWLVLPALQLNQFAVVDGKFPDTGLTQPVAAMFWAWVSPEVDQRLSASQDPMLRLAPPEWKSGDILWVIDVVGDLRVMGHVIEQVRASQWQGRAPKARSRQADGRFVIGTLEPKPPAAAN